jgi:hypothetical protein
MRALIFAVSFMALASASGTACTDPGDPPAKGGPVKENRLARERSPYLRQHKDNPVDWFAWGAEAFEKARAEDKPVLLSVGYAACHWCHVMEHESFEDAETARLMNEVFVCVKVDREERPDVDKIYMTYLHLTGRRGGWPMTVLMTPAREPFWGGTYLPREATRDLCRQIRTAWREQRQRIETSAHAAAARLADMATGPEVPETDDSDAQILKTMRDALAVAFDERHGGYGTRPKFPPHTELLYLLDRGGRYGEAGSPEYVQVFRTLDAMAAGGIHDHVGGGFHRYSTDAHWLLPHFEKMLYDNALLAQAYAGAYAQSGAPRYRRVVEHLFAWLEREMKRPEGGYASSLDADTEGEEGLTYTWTLDELAAVLDEADLNVVTRLYGVRAGGNFDDEATGRATGRNILHRPEPLPATAKALGTTVEDLRKTIERIDGVLLAARARRPQPGLDDKVITAWNGLLLSAFARAGSDLDEPAFLERARGLARFLLERCRRADGALLRFPAGSGPEIPGFCDDHVHLIDGLLDLAEATGERAWVEAARDLADRLNAEFQDEENGGFFTTSGARHETLIARAKETYDSPIPSDNGVAARVNLRIARATGEAAYREVADRTLATFRSTMAHPRMVSGSMALLRALTLRGELEAEGGFGAARGDVHRRADVVAADVFLERGQARPGSRLALLVRVRLDAGWHVNANDAGRADLVGTSLVAGAKAPAALVDVRYPPARRRVVGPAGGDALPLYEDTFDIRAALEVPPDAPPGPRRIPLVLRLQPCDEHSCREALELHLDVPLRFDAADGQARHPSLFRR